MLHASCCVQWTVCSNQESSRMGDSGGTAARDKAEQDKDTSKTVEGNANENMDEVSDEQTDHWYQQPRRLESTTKQQRLTSTWRRHREGAPERRTGNRSAPLGRKSSPWRDSCTPTTQSSSQQGDRSTSSPLHSPAWRPAPTRHHPLARTRCSQPLPCRSSGTT